VDVRGKNELFARARVLLHLNTIPERFGLVLAEANAAWVQIDEPVLALDLSEKAKAALVLAYRTLRQGPAPDILLASYFGPLGDNLATAAGLPVAGLHIDLVRGAGELDAILDAVPAERWLSLGPIDGRNIWRADLRAPLAVLEKVAARRGISAPMWTLPASTT
jgi:5-methyltetrahydropteroyltriglutamate--homocysteine methyltransferase